MSDEAIIKMVDANIQREEILPSERAFSFKMKMDAIKRQGARDDLTSGTEFQKSGIKVDSWSREVVGDEAGMTGRQVAKYIRLTELIPELLDNVDVKKITLTMGADLSYLDVQVQKWVHEYFKENGFLKPVQVEALKNHSNLSNASQHMIITILNIKYFDEAVKGLEAQLEELAKAQKFIFMEYHAIEDAEAWHKIQDVLEERVKAGVEIKNDLIRTMGECRDVTDQYSETTFQKIVDFERSFLLCLIAGTGNLHG